MKFCAYLFNSNRPMWIFYMLCMTGFVYLIFYKQTWRQDQSDLNMSLYFTSILSGSLVLLKCNGYCLLYVGCRMWNTVKRSGWLPFVLFALFACLFSYVFVVTLLDGCLLFAWSLAKERWVSTLENNIINLADGERGFPKILQGGNSFLHNYVGEDVTTASCTFDVIGVAHRLPNDDFILNMTWTFNDKPIMRTSRHDFALDVKKVTYKEVVDKAKADIQMFGHYQEASYGTDDVDFLENPFVQNTWERNKDLFELTFYRIFTSLRINGLEAFDFGNYSCSSVDALAYFETEVENQYRNINPTYTSVNGHFPQNMNDMKTNNREDADLKENSDQHVQFFSIVDDIYYIFKCWHVTRHISLPEVTEHTKKMNIPLGAIVHISTYFSYAGRYDEDAAFTDFLINSRPIPSFVSDSYCSTLVRLYYDVFHPYKCTYLLGDGPFWGGSVYLTPPYIPELLHSIDRHYDFPELSVSTSNFRVTFCMGPETYGLLEAEITRRHKYNSRTKQHELTSVPYPRKTFLVPERQHLILQLLFGDEPDSSPSRLTDFDRKNVSDLELELLHQLALAEADTFHFHENVFIIGVVVLCSLVLILLLYLIDLVGRLGKRLILFDRTSPQHETEADEKNAGNPYRELSRQSYDVFLSLPETGAGHVGQRIAEALTAIGQRVFLPERDIPPNAPELSVTDVAIENSRRFIFFFSEQYRQEKMYEAETIIKHLQDEGKIIFNQVLVVKLDCCRLPRWLEKCTVHDWVTFDPEKDRHLNYVILWSLGFDPTVPERLAYSCIDRSFLLLSLFLGIVFVFLIILFVLFLSLQVFLCENKE